MSPGQTAKGVVALLAGCLFAVGLGLAGMTDPAKVIGFLDLFGRWDPTLLFVMAAAIGVHMPVALWVRRQQRRGSQTSSQPVSIEGCGVPAAAKAASSLWDPKLLGGAAVFGVGWGISGLCPGPAIVSVGASVPGAAPFVVGMIAGVVLHALVVRVVLRSGTSQPASDASFET